MNTQVNWSRYKKTQIPVRFRSQLAWNWIWRKLIQRKSQLWTLQSALWIQLSNRNGTWRIRCFCESKIRGEEQWKSMSRKQLTGQLKLWCHYHFSISAFFHTALTCVNVVEWYIHGGWNSTLGMNLLKCPYLCNLIAC